VRRPLLALGLAAFATLAPVTGAQAAVPGALDGSYGSCGVLRAPKAAEDAVPAGALPVPGGGLIAVGTDRDTLVTVKLLPGGQVDAAYGNAGVTKAKLGGFTRPSYRFAAVAAQSGGRIVAAGAGAEQNAPTDRAALARLNSDGSLDATFGAGGVVTDAFPGGTQASIEDVDVDAAGRILVAGRRDDAFVVARFTPDGTPDASFGAAGVAQVALPGFKRGAAAAVRALPGGGAVAGGQADEQLALVRLRDDGTPDPSFGTGGATFESPPASAAVESVAPLPDGRIVVGGFGDDINGRHQVLGRYTPDGHPDPTFGRRGFALTDDIPSAGQLFVQADGSVIVASQSFARYTAAGTLDPAFGVGGTLPGSPVGTVVPQPDGSALGVAGRRTTMEFERYALADPALGGLAEQSALCGVSIDTRLVRLLVRPREESRFGGLEVGLTLLEPTTATWTMTVRADGRTYTIRTRRLKFDGAFPDAVVIPLTKRVQARLSNARRVHVTVTGRDAAGHTVTAERDLRASSSR
jgi:uncharacterized delta-60 repeat protein